MLLKHGDFVSCVFQVEIHPNKSKKGRIQRESTRGTRAFYDGGKFRLAAAAEDRSQRRAVEGSAEFDVQTECARMVALLQVGSEDRRGRSAGKSAGL